MGDKEKYVKNEIEMSESVRKSYRPYRARKGHIAVWFRSIEGVMSSLEELARKNDVPLVFPMWLYGVPGECRVDAMRRHVVASAEKSKKRILQKHKSMEIRKALKEKISLPIHQLEKLGCNTAYMYLRGYKIILAYKSGTRANEVYVWFSVCSPEEDNAQHGIPERKENGWMHRGRCILVDRVERDDDNHSFACLIQGQSQFGPKTLDYFVKRRFMEHAMLTRTGLPHEMVKVAREIEKGAVDGLSWSIRLRKEAAKKDGVFRSKGGVIRSLKRPMKKKKWERG